MGVPPHTRRKEGGCRHTGAVLCVLVRAKQRNATHVQADRELAEEKKRAAKELDELVKTSNAKYTDMLTQAQSSLGCRHFKHLIGL